MFVVEVVNPIPTKTQPARQQSKQGAKASKGLNGLRRETRTK